LTLPIAPRARNHQVKRSAAEIADQIERRTGLSAGPIAANAPVTEM